MYHFSEPSVEDTPANPAVPTPNNVSPKRISGGRQQEEAAIIERIEIFLASIFYLPLVSDSRMGHSPIFFDSEHFTIRLAKICSIAFKSDS